MNKKLFVLALLLTCWRLSVLAQPLDAWIKAGNKTYEQKDFYSAFTYYGIAVEYDSSRYDLWYKYAESARQAGQLKKADYGYNRVLGSPNRQEYPLAGFWLAEVRQRLGLYQSAADQYRKFLQEQPNAEALYRDAANKGADDCVWANMLTASERVKVSHYSSAINSRYSEFGLAAKGDTIYYSSLQFIDPKDTLNPPRPYAKILEVPGEASKPAPLPEVINLPRRHASHTAFNRNFTKVYYTICDYVNGGDIRCNLYSSDVSSDGKWGAPQKLVINANGGATNTQPHVAYDPVTDQEWLYFVSDRSDYGGKGQLDIWRSAIGADGSLGAPENLAGVNTPGNEATPFFHTTTMTLYFSSDGYHTLGGFDVCRSRQTAAGWATPENMGIPVNTSYNDLYFMLDADGAKGYLSSNRPDTSSVYWDDTREFCCNDIFQLTFDNVVNLKITAFNGLDSAQLNGVTIELWEITPEGKRLVSKITNPGGNDFSFPLVAGKKYEYKATKPGFTDDAGTIDLNQPEYQGLTNIDKRVYLNPGIDLYVNTFRSLDSTALSGATVELYEITPEGEKLVGTQSNAAGNDFKFTLERNKQYVIKAKRPGFAPVSETIDLTSPEYAKATRVDKKLYLGQLLEALTFDADDKSRLSGVSVSLSELGGGQPRLIDSLTNYSGNQFLFVIDLEKNYLITAEKLGYKGIVDTVRFTAEQLAESEGKVTIELYLERIDFKDFLPLTLYFDNAIPDPKSYAPTTDKDYLPLNIAYYDRREEFIQQNTEGLTGEDLFRTNRRFSDFFNREVRGGREDLQAFTDKLYSFLQNKNSITITIRGYCSPRGPAQYNKLLSARRADSVRNYFERYKNGALLPYLRNGRLKIMEEALGESKAPAGISDRLTDPKGSIYGILATLERRVEIVEVKTGNK